MKLGIVAIMFLGLMGLTACSKDDDNKGKTQSSVTKTDEVVSNISELRVAESGTNVVSSAENVAFVAAARANSDPVTKEPCTKHNVSVATNMYTVGTHDNPRGIKLRVSHKCIKVVENGAEVWRWTYWKDNDGNYYDFDELSTKIRAYKFAQCSYGLKKYSHNAKITSLNFYLSEQGTVVSPCDAITLKKDAYCDDGEVVWRAQDKTVTNADEYQYISCADYGKPATFTGCLADDGNIYPVGMLVARVSMYTTDFCSAKQGCRQLKELTCAANGELTPPANWVTYAPRYNKEQRVVVPDSVEVLDDFADKEVVQIGGCGKHMFVVAKALANNPSVDGEGNIIKEFAPVQGIYIFDQKDFLDPVDYRRPSTNFYNGATFTQMDNLTCIDQRYLAGTQRVETQAAPFKGGHADLFMIDLERVNKTNGLASIHSSGPGFGEKIKKLSLKVPNFRDAAPLAEVDDVELGTAQVIRGKNQITALFMSYDTTIYAVTAELNNDGSFPVNYLYYNTYQVDPNYSEKRQYFNTSIYDVGDKSGNFYVVKRTTSKLAPITLACQVNKDSFTCDPVELKNISGSTKIDFTLLAIDEAPYLMAWNTSNGQIQKIYKFTPQDGVLDGNQTALSATQIKAVKNWAAEIVKNKVPAGEQYVFTKGDKVYWLTFDEKNNLVAEGLTPAALAADKDLANHAQLADIATYARVLKNKLGDASPEIISAKGTLPYYYLFVKPQDFDDVIFKATPEGLKELIDTSFVLQK